MSAVVVDLQTRRALAAAEQTYQGSMELTFAVLAKAAGMEPDQYKRALMNQRAYERKLVDIRAVDPICGRAVEAMIDAYYSQLFED
jgi:hypothetical protein